MLENFTIWNDGHIYKQSVGTEQYCIWVNIAYLFTQYLFDNS